jgi:HAE1 family hydrophobic/amphiphilic exporter-1
LNGFERLTMWYRDRALPLAIRNPGATIGICALLFGLSLLLPVLGFVQSEFIASSNTGTIAMTVTYPTGTPLATTQAGVDRLEAAILKLPGMRSTITTTGTKPAGWGVTIGGNVARLFADLDAGARKQTNATVERIRELAPLVPGAQLTVAAAGGSASGSDPIFYTLSGPEESLTPAAEKLAGFIRSLPGTVNVQTGSESEGDRLNITIDRARAAVLGISPGTAANAARAAVGGAVATKVRTESGLIDVRVQLPDQFRRNIRDLQNIKVRASDGSIYRLADIATFEFTKAATKIERLDRQRVVRVTGGFDPEKTTFGAVTAKIEAAVAQPGFLPNGVGLRTSGDSQFFGEMIQSMTIAIVTSTILVYILMVILYGSFVTPFVVMFSIPVAVVGALVALAITGQTLNLFSLIAMLMLFGLVAKNAILLVDYANLMRRRGLPVFDAMRAAAGLRLRPIVMTTMAMVFGMLPLSLGFAEGAEFRRSMGTVLIGGLLSSLVLTLFLVPAIYTLLIGFIERRATKPAPIESTAAGAGADGPPAPLRVEPPVRRFAPTFESGPIAVVPPAASFAIEELSTAATGTTALTAIVFAVLSLQMTAAMLKRGKASENGWADDSKRAR